MEKFLDRNIEEHTLDEDYVKERRRLKLNQGLQESPMALDRHRDEYERNRASEDARLQKRATNEARIASFLKSQTRDEKEALLGMLEEPKDGGIDEPEFFSLTRKQLRALLNK